MSMVKLAESYVAIQYLSYNKVKVGFALFVQIKMECPLIDPIDRYVLGEQHHGAHGFKTNGRYKDLS